MNQRLCSLQHVVRFARKRSSLSLPGSTAASLTVSKWYHSTVSTLPTPSRDASTEEFAGHLQDETQPESLEADGVKASRHERRVAQAMTFCFRHSDEPGVHWLASSVRATANGEAPAKDIVFYSIASLLSFAGIASQGTVSRL